MDLKSFIHPFLIRQKREHPALNILGSRHLIALVGGGAGITNAIEIRHEPAQNFNVAHSPPCAAEDTRPREVLKVFLGRGLRHVRDCVGPSFS